MFPQSKKSSLTLNTLSLFTLVLFLSITPNLTAQNTYTNANPYKKMYNAQHTSFRMLDQLQIILPHTIAVEINETQKLLPNAFTLPKNFSKKIVIQPQLDANTQQGIVKFSIPNSSRVWLSLYSSRGQKIATLLEGENIEAAIWQEISIEDIELTEETYLLQLETENETVWSDWWHLNN